MTDKINKNSMNIPVAIGTGVACTGGVALAVGVGVAVGAGLAIGALTDEGSKNNKELNDKNN